MRTLISGGLVVTPQESRLMNILVEDGKIAGLLDREISLQADQIIDASGLVVLPGALDGHTHFCPFDPLADHPVELDDEGFVYGGRGAAAGGVTTIMEMPQGYPPAISKAAIERKKIVGAEEAIVDFALWAGMRPGETADAIQGMLEAGVVGFKGYTCTGDPDIPMLNDADVLDALDALKNSGVMLALHTENNALMHALTARIKATGRTDPLTHAEARPALLEELDVERAIALAEYTGGWVHIAHMSSAKSAEMVRQAKARGVWVTAETCPQYLALDTDALVEHGVFAKCVPALRSRENVETFWDYLADGTIDCITTDHCGWTTSSKEKGMWEAPNGVSGIQTYLPAVISEARSRGFAWTDIARWTAGNPAELWHLAPRKGAIQVGADADLVFVQEDQPWTVKSEYLLHKQKWTPFEGYTMQARIVKTILRGVPIYDDGAPEKVLVEPGFGRFVPAIQVEE